MRRGKAEFGRVFIETFRRLGGEELFKKMAMASEGWVSAERMQQLFRERLSAYPSNLWPLWTTFAAELWFREVFTTSATPGDRSGAIIPTLTSAAAQPRVAAVSN